MLRVSEPANYTNVSVDNFDKIPSYQCGVYYLIDKYDEVIYIGKTRSFRRRLFEHRNSAYFFPHVVRARLYHIEKEFERDIYETFLINEYAPMYNKGKMWQAQDERNYYEELCELEAELDEIDAELALLGEDASFMDRLDECVWDDDVWADTDYEQYDDKDRLIYALGDSLYNADRERDLRRERSVLLRKIKNVKSFII